MAGWSKMSDIRLAALLGLFAAACTSPPPVRPVVTVEADKQAILDVIARMEAAWNRGDFPGYMRASPIPT